MDPLSVAASVVGLISAGAQLVPMLYNLSSAIKDAPQHAQAAVSELGNITVILTQLQKYIDGRAQASIQRLNLITVEHITATLTDCVMTYSELDALLKALHLDKGLKAWDRAVWFVKKDDVALLTSRLQNHKATFGLMLNIIQCASMDEAENNMDRLCEMVNQVLLSNQRLSLRLRNMESMIAKQHTTASANLDHADEATPGADDVSRKGSLAGSFHRSNSSTSIQSPSHSDALPRTSAELGGSRPKVSAFEELLHRSRVYRHAAGHHSESSLIDDGRSTLAISICSSLTLGDVSKISVYALPVYANEISNPECYDFAARDRSEPEPGASSHRDTQIGTSSSRTLSSWWKTFKRSKQENPTLPDLEESTGSQEILFGVPLLTSIRYANVAVSLYNDEGESHFFGYLPIIVVKIGVFLKEKGTDAENIFQAAGSPKRLRELQKIFSSPPKYGKGFSWDGYTVFDAGSLLLRYLLQLPEPVIPLAAYSRFREPLEGQLRECTTLFEAPLDDDDVNEIAGKYQVLIAELPALNRQLLLYLLDTLAVFASNSKVNRMSLPKLVAHFQPGILDHPEHKLMTKEVDINQGILAFLIDQQDYFLFGKSSGTTDTQRSSNGQ